jgi:hypothetical protein
MTLGNSSQEAFVRKFGTGHLQRTDRDFHRNVCYISSEFDRIDLK